MEQFKSPKSLCKWGFALWSYSMDLSSSRVILHHPHRCCLPQRGSRCTSATSTYQSLGRKKERRNRVRPFKYLSFQYIFYWWELEYRSKYRCKSGDEKGSSQLCSHVTKKKKIDWRRGGGQLADDQSPSCGHHISSNKLN